MQNSSRFIFSPTKYFFPVATKLVVFNEEIVQSHDDDDDGISDEVKKEKKIYSRTQKQYRTRSYKFSSYKISGRQEKKQFPLRIYF